MNEQANQILEKIKNQMEQTQNRIIQELSSIRSEISNPNILNKINVMYYGIKTPLKQVCSVSVVQNNQLNLKPYDNNLITEIKKSILASNLGITPNTDGHIIKLIFPPLTEERRKQLTKEVEKISENTKIIIRNIRRDGNNKIKKIELTKDLEALFLKKIQNLTDDYISKTENKINQKNKELLKI